MFALSKFIVFVAVQCSIVQTTNGATCDSAISISRNCGTGGCDFITFRNEEIQHALAEVSDDLSDAFETRCEICNDQGNLSVVPRDCMDIQKLGYRKTGVYTICPLRSTPVQVRCDMDTDGGGWTLIQRRVSNSDFYKSWQEYKVGFGDLNGNFWLGNEIINTLTASGSTSLRIDMRASGETSYATYSNFTVGNEAAKYQLSVVGYNGLAGDSFIPHTGMKFTTKDQDNDPYKLNCADVYHGGWWYMDGCHQSNLNGEFGNTNRGEGIVWYSWKGHYESLTMSEMKIRRA